MSDLKRPSASWLAVLLALASALLWLWAVTVLSFKLAVLGTESCASLDKIDCDGASYRQTYWFIALVSGSAVLIALVSRILHLRRLARSKADPRNVEGGDNRGW